MSPLQALLSIASVAGLFALAGGVRAVGVARGWSAELQRKAVHVGVGVHAMLLPTFLDRSGFLFFAGMALPALLVMRTDWCRGRAGAAVHCVERRSWGDLLFLAAVCVLFLRAPGSLEYYVLPLCVLTVSDTVAALIGTNYGRLKFGAGGIKSVEGTVAFMLATWIVVVSVLLLGTSVDRVRVVWLATVVSAIVAMVEADSWSGLDNVFIPVGTYAFLLGWGGASPLQLGLSALAWMAVLFGAERMAPVVKLTPHAFRAAFATLFLASGFNQCAVAVYAILALGGHLLARRPAGHRAGFDDLEFVVAFSLLGLVWLTLGMLGGRPEIEFYAMSMMAMVAGYAPLAMPWRSLGARLVAAMLAVVAAVLLSMIMYDSLPPAGLWMPRSCAYPLTALSSLMCALASAMHPRWFTGGNPDFRITALAIPIPILAYGVLA